MIFWQKKKKIDNFDPYNALLAIATNIYVRLMTSFMVQGHKRGPTGPTIRYVVIMQ